MAKRSFKLKANLGTDPSVLLTVGNGRSLSLKEGDVHETSDPAEIAEFEASPSVKEVAKGDKD